MRNSLNDPPRQLRKQLPCALEHRRLFYPPEPIDRPLEQRGRCAHARITRCEPPPCQQALLAAMLRLLPPRRRRRPPRERYSCFRPHLDCYIAALLQLFEFRRVRPLDGGDFVHIDRSTLLFQFDSQSVHRLLSPKSRPCFSVFPLRKTRSGSELEMPCFPAHRQSLWPPYRASAEPKVAHYRVSSRVRRSALRALGCRSACLARRFLHSL